MRGHETKSKPLSRKRESNKKCKQKYFSAHQFGIEKIEFKIMSDPRRKVLKEAVCLLVSEVGFTVATEECIETLVEMLLASKFLFVDINSIVYDFPATSSDV